MLEQHIDFTAGAKVALTASESSDPQSKVGLKYCIERIRCQYSGAWKEQAPVVVDKIEKTYEQRSFYNEASR